MRHVLPFLVLVFALVTGACAGRQVRTHHYAAPPLAEPVAVETADVDAEETTAFEAVDTGACPADPAQGSVTETETEDVEIADAAPAAPTVAPAVAETPAAPAVAKKRIRAKVVSSAALTAPVVKAPAETPVAASPPLAAIAAAPVSVLETPSIAVPAPAAGRTITSSSPDGVTPSEPAPVAGTPSRAPPPFLTFSERIARDWPIFLLVLAAGLLGGFLLSRRRSGWVTFDETSEASRPSKDDEPFDSSLFEAGPKPVPPAAPAPDPDAPVLPTPLPPPFATRKPRPLGPVPLPGLPPVRPPLKLADGSSDRLKTSADTPAVSGIIHDRPPDPKDIDGPPQVIHDEPTVSTHLN